MKQDRRSFLTLFGISGAAVAALPSADAKEPTIETVHMDARPEPARTDIFGNRQDRGHFQNSFLDIRNGLLWSQLRIEPNSMQIRYNLFQDTCGSTLAETNMQQAGCLPNPERFCIQKIGFVFSPKTIPGLRSAFIDRYALALWLGRKRYWNAPMSAVFSVGEPDRDAKGFATLPDAAFTTLDIPLIIDVGLYFNLEVLGEPIHPCGKIIGWAVFKGLHAVGIQ